MITLEALKKSNRIFFANAGFHGDKEYRIISHKGRNLLRVNTALTGWVTYEIGGKGKFSHDLTYTKYD